MPSDREEEYIPQPNSSGNSLTRAAPGATGEDPADNPEYDSDVTSQKIDSEVLKRRKIGRWMSVIAVGTMATFAVAFFCYAIIYAHRFIQLYVEHVHHWVSTKDVQNAPAIIPFIIPMIPATFFSVLGLVTMVTCIRFISSYINASNEESNKDSVIERVAREVGEIIRTAKGYNE